MVVQVNPFDKLIRMLQQRIERQQSALRDSESQLDAAIKSSTEWSEQQMAAFQLRKADSVKPPAK